MRLVEALHGDKIFIKQALRILPFARGVATFYGSWDMKF
jgi:hypothetical protein